MILLWWLYKSAGKNQQFAAVRLTSLSICVQPSCSLTSLSHPHVSYNQILQPVANCHP